ncbi:hypothetical protein UlMin_030525 [Ulmus minor]
MAEAVVSFVLEKLGDEAEFLRGVTEKFEDVKRELGMIRCFLKDADARARNGDETLALWVQEITDAAYDLDDVVSTFVLTHEAEAEAEAAATKGVFDKVVDCLLFKRPIELHKVGSEIDKILNRLSKLNQNLQSYGVLRNNNVGDAISSNQRRNDLRRTYAHVPEDDFVENEGAMMKLVTQLTKKGNSGSPFVSIHGMGGLGKTTLAKEVYHHKQVRKNFNCFAWVFVSQQFTSKDILKGVLIDLVSDPREKEEIGKMERQEKLAEKLYDVLQEQKCLVVLDDVWNTEDLDRLKADVGEHADRRGFLYQPRHLDDIASWELLKKKAFFREDAKSRGYYEDMEKFGKEMVKDCRGLPLAIVVLGGLLSTKHTVDEWKAVKQNVKELINKGQKDYEINVKELCRLWTAEDFVPAEDKARECLMALVDRSMVQGGRRSSIVVGRIKTCRMHDLMRYLSLEMGKKENFFHRINFQVPGESLPTSNVRRLAVQLNDDNVDGLPRLTKISERCLRSLLCFAPKVRNFNDLMESLFNRFNMLKVFKFEVISEEYDEERVHQIPEEIGKLIHLRLISFNDCGLLFLPPSVANLRCLQTLDLRMSMDLNSVDLDSLRSMNVISKLDHLRHLYLPQFSHLEEDGFRLRLDNLSSLETLVNFNPGYCELDDLSQFTKLTKLSIRTCQALGEINPKSNLQSLSIDGLDSFTELRDIVPLLSRYPQIQKLKLNRVRVNSLENVIFFPNLVKLTLVDAILNVDPMPIFGKLSKLRILALSKGAYNGKIIVCGKYSFPQLESLSLDNLRRLEEWRVEEGALSKLCRLEIYGCEDLKSYPNGLRNITTLKEIKLTEMGEDFMTSFDQKGGDEDSTRRSSKSE